MNQLERKILSNSLTDDFWCRMTMIKEHKVPTQVHSASLKPDMSIFVCGGEDFKIYKYDYNTGAELGNWN